ncbi:helix-turn-helix domain-containing protein [Streptomyces sp. TLI_185]|uniref:helix-turn-helix domain-containing protein n=1 Tax=Streptomyces sp. TLI_185 TaxID=2485151 RepID=UPI0016099B04|nr:helix-turn-helix domain-containing protein [Streptomyces sp. TLI_185]
MSSTQADRIVGVRPRTGRDWRDERPEGRVKRPRPRAQDASAVAVRSATTRFVEVRGDSRHLGEDERRRIADRLREKATVRAIEAEPGRSPSAVQRVDPPQPAPRERPVPAARRARSRTGSTPGP